MQLNKAYISSLDKSYIPIIKNGKHITKTFKFNIKGKRTNNKKTHRISNNENTIDIKSSPKDPNINNLESKLYFDKNAPTWEELASMLEKRRIELNYKKQDLETGPTNAKALKRTFNKDEPIRIKLYRDTAAWCPYCQKIWLQLEEKKIPYIIEKINLSAYGEKPENFSKINPKEVVPVLELDGNIYTDSSTIRQVIEDSFPDYNPLMPKEPEEQERVQKLYKLSHEEFRLPDFKLIISEDEPDPSLYEVLFDKCDRLNEELGKDETGPYFFGSKFTLADIDMIPLIERLEGRLIYYMGIRLRDPERWPNIKEWLDAMDTRDIYLATKADYYTNAHIFKAFGTTRIAPNAQKYADKIDGKIENTWDLPLEPLSINSFEPYVLGDNPDLDRHIASERLVENHEVVTKFSLRSMGQAGIPSFRAELSDPNAIPNLDYMEQVDVIFRHVTNALINGPDKASFEVSNLQNDNMIVSDGVVLSLSYIRDRVGVPKDVSLPVARQLRAHFNWAINLLKQ